MRIADMPNDERPRGRLARSGVESLSDSEVLALLISSGIRDRNALEIARALLADGIDALARSEWGSYRREAGVGHVKASRIAAAFELGRRAAGSTNCLRDPIRDPERIAKSLLARYSHRVQEVLGALYLDAKGRAIREREIYVGTINSALVSTRDILRHALSDHAPSVIVFHNHPSGDPAPSAEDLAFTRQLVEAGRLLGVEVLDHLIVGANRFASLKQRGDM